MLVGCYSEVTRFNWTTSASVVWEMLLIITRDSLNKVWQADVKAVMNFRFIKFLRICLPLDELSVSN